MVYDELYYDGTGVRIGSWIQSLSNEIYSDLTPYMNGTEIDHLCNGVIRVETKCVRAVRKCVDMNPADQFDRGILGLSNKALTAIPEQHTKGLRDGLCYRLGNNIFQQVHPKRFDFLNGVVIYRNVIRLYIIPAADILNHLNAQHAYTPKSDAGSFPLRQKTFGGYLAHEITAKLGTDGRYMEGEIGKISLEFLGLARQLESARRLSH